MAPLEKDIFFHHIMKTAGITVCHLLESVYGARRWCSLPEHEGIDPGPYLERIASPEPLVVSGHPHHLFPLWEKARARAMPRLNMVFLRHPVDRFLSCYWFIKRSNYVQRHVSSFDLSLEQAVTCDDPRLAANMMTKCLASLGRPRDYAAPATKDDFMRAMDNLQAMDIIGLVEQFPASVALLGSVLGFEPPPVTSWNVNSSYPGCDEIGKEIRKAIMLRNMLDYRLYQQALDMFRLRLSQGGEGLATCARAVKANDLRFMVRQVDDGSQGPGTA